MTRILLRAGTLCAALTFASTHAGAGDLVFSSSFEDSPAMTNCPAAPTLTAESNGLGGTFYRATDAIDPPGQVDYFRFDANADEWWLLATDGNFDSDPALIDTVLVLYSGDGSQQLARSDDATPRVNPNSELYYLARETGPLCISVEDASTASGDTPRGGPEFVYGAIALPIDFDLYDEFNQDLGNNDSTAMAQTGLTYSVTGLDAQNATSISGAFDSLSDVDVYQLETPAQALRLQVTFTPDGINGYGGTTPLSVVEILAGDGSTVVGRLDYANGADALSLPINALSSYFLRVNNPPGPLGDNPFYVLKYNTLSSENPQEANEPANNASAGAEVATPLPGPGQTSHFIGGSLSGPGDTDWWSIQASAGDTISLFCASQRNGSGVFDLTVRLYDNPSASPLQQDIESATIDLGWSSNPGATRPAVPVVTTGTHFIAFQASLFSNEVTDRHYQCGIFVMN